MAVNNAKAVLEAIFGHQSAFVRTPKYGVDRKEDRRHVSQLKRNGTGLLNPSSFLFWKSPAELSS